MYINDKQAHRVGDNALHCGGIGVLITGSHNVIIGDYGGGAAAGAGGNPTTTADEFDEGFILTFEGTDEPIANRAYVITKADGTEIHGVTNGRGRTTVVNSDSEEAISIRFVNPQAD